MIPKDHTRSLARKLLEAKSQGKRLRVLEPAPRRASLSWSACPGTPCPRPDRVVLKGSRGKGWQARVTGQGPGDEEHWLLRELKREAIKEALELTVERVLAPRWQGREEEGLSPWFCHHCGSRLLSQMRRHGHCRRNSGSRGECKGCGKSIRVERTKERRTFPTGSCKESGCGW